MKKLYRALAICALSCLWIVAPPVDANAQLRVGSHAGIQFDGTDVIIGVNGWYTADFGGNTVLINPSLDLLLFIDNATVFAINLDGAYPFAGGTSFTPYVAAGLRLQFVNFDTEIAGVGGSDSDIGINIRAGAFIGDMVQRMLPFVEFGFIIGDSNISSAIVRGGVAFQITN